MSSPFGWPRFACALGVLWLMLGCQEQRSYDMTRGAAPTYVDTTDPALREGATTELSRAVQRGTRSWRLQPGDTLDVNYFVNSRVAVRDYRLGIGDQIDVVVQDLPQFSRSHTVRPDGRITLVGRGEIDAANLRPTDLGRRIADRYRDEVMNPQVSVHVMRVTDDAERFTAMLSGPGGQRSQTVTVAPDGSVGLPMVRSIPASGLTVDELTTRVAAAYRQRLPGVQPTLRLSGSAGQVVFVFGEILRPGPQPAAPARTILQLVAAAGGPNEFAAMDQVRLLYWDPTGQPRIRVANLNNVLERLEIDEDMVVPPGAILYVPPTQLARAGRMMDQIFRRLFLYNGTTAGFYFSSNLPPYLGGSR